MLRPHGARSTNTSTRDWRLFFAGPSEWVTDGDRLLPMDGSPVQFIFPGEPGFFATQPIFDCDAVMSRPEDDSIGLVVPARAER